jgi:hypothetical protein
MQRTIASVKMQSRLEENFAEGMDDSISFSLQLISGRLVSDNNIRSPKPQVRGASGAGSRAVS